MKKDWANIHWKLVQPVTVLALGGRETSALIENKQLCIAQLYISGLDKLQKMPRMGIIGIGHINHALETIGFRALASGEPEFTTPPEVPDLLSALPPHQRLEPKYWRHVFETPEFLEFQKSLAQYLDNNENAFHLQLAADPKGFYNLQLQALNQDPATPPEQPTIADIFNDPKMQEIIRAQAENPTCPDRPSTGILKDPDAAEIMRKAMAPKLPKNSL